MSRNERAPAPHAPDAEASVLSSVLMDNAALDECDDLSADDFYEPRNAAVFDVMRWLHGNGAPIDTVSLIDELRSLGRLAAVGGLERILELTNTVPAYANVAAHARRIVDKARLRRLMRACDEVAIEASHASGDVDKFLDGAETKLLEAAAQRSRDRGLVLLRDAAERRFNELKQARDRGQKITGLQVGIDRLDNLTRGFKAGQLWLLAGRPAMGKSAAATTMVEHVAEQIATRASGSGAVLFFTLEMSETEVVDRHLSGRARIDGKSVSGADMTQEEWDRLAVVVDQLGRFPILIDDTAGISITQIRARARRARARFGRIAMVAVDYLQLGTSGQDTDSREEEVATIARGLKNLAKDLDCPVLALAQLNRGVEHRPDKRPGLKDLRESGALEQDADGVIFVYRDEVYNPENVELRGIAEFIVAKQRGGPTGSVRARFFPEFTRFGNLEQSAYQGNEFDDKAPPKPSQLEQRALAAQAKKREAEQGSFDDDAPHPAEAE